jgi:hypothetical protein
MPSKTHTEPDNEKPWRPGAMTVASDRPVYRDGWRQLLDAHAREGAGVEFIARERRRPRERRFARPAHCERRFSLI